MPCDQWFEIEKRYRIAVQAYSDAVDRLDSARDFAGEWRHINAARTHSDRVRMDLLTHQSIHRCLASAASFWDTGSEELVLGDQGQPGG